MEKNRILFWLAFLCLPTFFIYCSSSATSKVSSQIEDEVTDSANFVQRFVSLDSVVAYSADDLYLEIVKGEVQTVKRMLPFVDDVNVFVRVSEDEHFVYSPLGVACKLGNDEIIEELLAVPGIDLLLGCTDGIYEFDAVYVALDSNRDSLFYKLIEHGADIDGIYTASGITLLTVAIRNENIPVVRYLLDYGGLSPNGTGSLGGAHQFLPLNMAVKNKNLEMVQVLIERGADPNVSDQQGITPFSLARKLGYKEIELLLEAYVDFGN